MPRIVSVINLSAESRNRDSVVHSPEELLRRATSGRAAGAAAIEIGARSSSAESPVVSEREEQRRLLPALRLLKREGFRVSVDTWSPATAAIAASEGADILNFTGSELPPELLRAIAAGAGAVVIAYAPFGDPYAMRTAAPSVPTDADLRAYFEPRIAAANDAGIGEVILDPNLGIVHSSIRANREFLMAFRASLAFRAVRLFGEDHAVMLDHPRRDAGDAPAVWAMMLLNLAPDYLRTHDPELVQRLGDALRRVEGGAAPGGET